MTQQILAYTQLKRHLISAILFAVVTLEKSKSQERKQSSL